MANGIKAGRRGFMKAAGAGALLSVPMINLGYYRLGASDRTYSARSVAIVVWRRGRVWRIRSVAKRADRRTVALR